MGSGQTLSQIHVGEIDGEERSNNVLSNHGAHLWLRSDELCFCKRWRSLVLVEIWVRAHVPSRRHRNEVIGAYATAGARIRLYRYLDRLR